MSIEKAILPIKIKELVQMITEKKNLDITDSIGYLYSSTFYKRLSNPKAKWWYMSGSNLYKELEKEKKIQQQKEKNKSNEVLFIIFCTENYRKLKQMEGMEVHTLFLELNVYDFLMQNYEILHTQGENYILEEIEGYLKNHIQK
jgi:hypothetical protein